jgi:photosystem II stability/assembly factor-like uncharacterized protein
MKYILSFITLVFLFSSSPIIAQIPYWHQTNGPEAGTLREMTIDSSGNVIVWTAGSGVYKSTDNGSSWKLLNKGLPILSMKRGAYSTSGYLFAINSAAPTTTQLFRFNENTSGAQWENISPVNSSYINDIMALPKGSVFLATGRGILRSDDNGLTWKQKNVHLADSINKTTKDSNTVFLVSDGKGNIYAGLQKGSVSRSSDNGETWTKFPLRDPDGQLINALAATPNGNVVVGNFYGKIYLTTNNGTSWDSVYQRPHNTQEQKNDIDKIVLAPGSNILYANAHGITLRSADNGRTWVTMDSEKRGDEPFSMAVNGNNIFQMSEPDGIFLSNDNGSTWASKNKGFYAQLMWDIAINSKQEIFGITEYGLHRSTDNGDTWDQAPEYGETYFPSIYIDKKDYLYIGTSFGLFRSKDNGNTINNLPVTDSATIIQVGKDPVQQKLYCSYSVLNTAFSFIVSTDDGDHWSKVTQLPVQNARIDAFAFASKDSILLASGTSYYLSTNNGINWTTLSDNSNIGTYKLIILSDGSYLSLVKNGGNGGVYHSTDGAQTWTQIFPSIAEGFPNFNTYFSMMVDDKGRIIVCTDSGIYRSFNNTDYLYWQGISTGMTAQDFPNHYISASAVAENPLTHVFFAASRGLSVFRSIPDFDTSKVGVAINKSISPEITIQPNPFSTSTNVAFTLEKESNIRIELFDVLGRPVKMLYSGFLSEGQHSILCEAGDLSAGNYSIILQDGSRRRSISTILVR